MESFASTHLARAITEAISVCRLMEIEADLVTPPPEGETPFGRYRRIVGYCLDVYPAGYPGRIRAVSLERMRDRVMHLQARETEWPK